MNISLPPELEKAVSVDSKEQFIDLVRVEP
jgi:hypothetical protein